MTPTSISLLTHDDFDGVGCAALFYRKYGVSNVTIRFVPVHMVSKIIEKFDYITDLPKPLGGGINIDHHKSNFEVLTKEGRLRPKDVVDPQAPAAAALVFDALNLSEDKTAQEIRDISILADTAQLPQEYRDISRMIEWFSDDEKVLLELAKKFASLGKEILQDSWVKIKITEFDSTLKEALNKIDDFFHENTLEEFLLLDTRDSIPGKMKSEIFHPVFEKKVIVLGVIYHGRDKGVSSISFRVAKPYQDQFDVSIIAKSLGGGGHTMAAAARINGSEETKKITQVLQFLEKCSQGDVKGRVQHLVM